MADSRLEHHGRLTVRRIKSWSSTVTELASGLTQSRLCPPELYAELLERNLRSGGRIAVVERRNEPIALIGLQRDGRFRWKPVANWLVPDFVCAAADDDALPALAALGTEISVSWWRRSAFPAHEHVRERRDIATHHMAVAHREAYWRKTGRWRGIMKARQRCEGLTLSVNEPGGSEWVIHSAAVKWQGHEEAAQDATVHDRVDVVRHLESSGKHITLVLRDGDRRLSGEACIIDGDTLVSVLAYRDEEVGSLPTGIRTMDAIFQYAEQHGFANVDLGGHRPYKLAWAPEQGMRHEFLVAPRHRHHARQMVGRIRQRLT